MKSIKIKKDNAVRIEEILHQINGRAEAHAYTLFREIDMISDQAEAHMDKLGIPKKDRKGAIVTSTSGFPVSNSYSRKGFRRQATTVTLERRATGWFLADAVKTEVWQQGGGADQLTLTPEQDEIATNHLHQQYEVAQA